MGGRKGPSSHKILKGKGAPRAQANVQRKLRSAPSQVVAKAAFKAAATMDPTIGALYLAYKVAQYTYPIVKEGVKEYAKTGDKDAAVEKMKDKTVDQVGKAVKEKAVEVIVGVAVDDVKDVSGIVVEKAADTFVKAAVSETIKEMIK